MADDKSKNKADKADKIDGLIGTSQSISAGVSNSVEGEEKPKHKSVPTDNIKLPEDVYSLYNYLAENEGLNVDFNKFLADAVRTYARTKNGIQLAVLKTKNDEGTEETKYVVEKVGNGGGGDDESSSAKDKTDDFDQIFNLIMGIDNNPANLKSMAIKSMLEDKAIQRERMRLENEKIKAEIENMRKTTAVEVEKKTKEDPQENSMVQLMIAFMAQQAQQNNAIITGLMGALQNSKNNNDNSKHDPLEIAKMLNEANNRSYEVMMNVIVDKLGKQLNEVKGSINYNPLNSLTENIAVIKELSSMFQPQQNPELYKIDKEAELKKMEYDLKKEELRASKERMDAFTSVLGDGVTALAETVGKAYGSKIEQKAENNIESYKNNVNAEEIEGALNQYVDIPEPPEPVKTDQPNKQEENTENQATSE